MLISECVILNILVCIHSNLRNTTSVNDHVENKEMQKAIAQPTCTFRFVKIGRNNELSNWNVHTTQLS